MSHTFTSKSLKKSVDAAFNFAQQQVRHLITKHPDYFPLYTKNGKWVHEGEAWTRWCDGFLGGMLWIFAEQTGDSWWLEKAKHYARLIEPRKNEKTTQSLGSLFMPTWKRWYDFSGDQDKLDVVIEAGRTLALRFNQKGRYLASFVAPKSNLIDNMMSVILIFYTAQKTGDQRLQEIAIDHCMTVRRHSIRGDGSIAHEAIFNPDTGEFLRHDTHQGWRADSSWARGQAWTIYGFSNAYKFTGEEKFLDTAKKCADFYIERTSSDGVPPNDWEEPSPEVDKESSAAAVAASAFFRLAALQKYEHQQIYYQQYAERILTTLCKPPYLANNSTGWEGILKLASYHERKGLGVKESVMWGDYYFVEALQKYSEKQSANNGVRE
jgi:unsaturated chondroitin disaccharide hydrolase